MELHIKTSSVFDLGNRMPYGKQALGRQRAHHSFLQVLSIAVDSDVVSCAQSVLCACSAHTLSESWLWISVRNLCQALTGK